MRPRRQRLTTPSTMRAGSVQRAQYSVGALATVLTVSVVALLLGSTFVAEWLRLPQFALFANHDLLSPNNDRQLDTASINLTLEDEATVTARVLGLQGGVVRVLMDEERLSSGQHTLLWDGRSEVGALAPDGQYRLEVYAAGTLRGAKRSVLLTVDTTPPALQLANIKEGERVGAAALTVQGVVEPQATLWVTGQPQPLTVDSSGRFAFQRQLTEGANLIEVRAVDAAGNTAVVQRQVQLVTAPPDVTVTLPQEAGYTNQSMTTVQGMAPAGVKLLVNDQPVSVAADGSFTHQVLLNEGENRLRIQAVDDVGNVTNLERLVYLRTRPPEVSLSVGEGVTVNDSLLNLSGRTEPGVTVQLNGRVIPVSALGEFQSSIFLVEGDNLVEVTARDQAGNLTNIRRRIVLADGAAAGGWERLGRNFASLPGLTIPLLAAAVILLLFFFLRQNQVALALSVDQTSFTPGLPGEDRMVELALELNKAARVSLEVLDEDGNVMTTLLHNRRRTGRIHLFRWDGYDDYGQPLPPGEYTIQATAGMAPARVSSAVQLTIRPDELVHRRVQERRTGRRYNR